MYLENFFMASCSAVLIFCHLSFTCKTVSCQTSAAEHSRLQAKRRIKLPSMGLCKCSWDESGMRQCAGIVQRPSSGLADERLLCRVLG